MNNDTSRNNIWKWLVLLIATGLSIFFVYPPLGSEKTPDAEAVPGKLRFGLDLTGGTEFTLGIDRDALSDTIYQGYSDAERTAERDKAFESIPAKEREEEAAKIRAGEGGKDLTAEQVTERLKKSVFDARLDALAKVQLKERITRDVDEALKGVDERVEKVIRRRVDGLGMNEPEIQSLKSANKDDRYHYRYVVQLPGISEKAYLAAKSSLQGAAFLEFRLLHPNNDEEVSKLLRNKSNCPEGYVREGDEFRPATNYLEIAQRPGFQTRLSNFQVKDPQRYQFIFKKNKNGSFSPAFVQRQGPARNAETHKAERITGQYLKRARAENDSMGSFSIGFEFDGEGAKLFEWVTDNYRAGGARNKTGQGRQLAIILDNLLISAPVIQSKISRNGQITGDFTYAEARQLANDLNAGALPAPLDLLGETSVSASVGESAKQDGLVAAGLGFALVALFMLIYYWYAGLVANIALFLNFVLLPFGLVLVANVLGAFSDAGSVGDTAGKAVTQLPVLTMPGIAGLVLTLGMAVDANVIIFERIREEFAAKVSTGTAVKNGYGRAFTAILDSNITTIVTGIILFVVGTGPVRGFAITLTAGVIVSMFTAVVVTRLVFDYTTKAESMKPFKMLNIFKKTPNFDFVGYGKKVFFASFALCLITVGLFFFRAFSQPDSVLAVDLTGGTRLTYAAGDSVKQGEGEIRKILDAFDKGASYKFNEGGKALVVKTSLVTKKADAVAKTEAVDVERMVTQALAQKFGEGNVTLKSNEVVGSVVGDDLKKSGTKAVIFSLCAILIYVAFRFEFGFGLGALVALAHDALIALGIYSLCGRQVSLLVITAILTIIGYSVNDTIVVFDRIREDLRKDVKTDFKALCNRALNECLSRTVITSLTTFFAVLALFAFGDGSIFDFALTMLIGVVAGTFSSVFIATPVMMWFYKGRRPQFEKAPEAEEE